MLSTLSLRALLGLATASCLLATAAPAVAGPLDFDHQQALIITAERLFGYSYSSTKDAGDNKSIDSNFSLLAPSGGAGAAYGAPTIGVHYPVIPALTLGLNLGLVRTGGSIEPKGGTSQDKDSSLGILLAPRVGYVLGINEGAYIWLRAGISYYRSSTGDDDKTKVVTSGVGLSADPMFVLTPVNHFGIMVGPVVDYPLSGSTKVGDGNSADLTITNFGLQFGLLGYL